MNAISNLAIVLNKEQNEYVAGDLIIGMVSFDISSAIVVHGIVLKVNGSARLHWREVTARNINTVDHRVVLIDKETKLLEDDSITPTLNRGHHQFPFFFPLPPDLPNSLLAKKGYVKYWLEAVIRFSSRLDKSLVEPFYVRALGCLESHMPTFTSLDRTASQKKGYNLLRCASGETNIHLVLDRVFATCGDRISIIAECINDSHVRMKRTGLRLVQVILFGAAASIVREKRSLLKIKGGTVDELDTVTWREERMIIPDCAPTGFPGLDNVFVEYFIQFKVVPYGLSNSFSTAVRIIIGSRPSPEYDSAMNVYETMSSESETSPPSTHEYSHPSPTPLPLRTSKAQGFFSE